MTKNIWKWMWLCLLLTVLIFSDVRAQNTQLILPESAEKRVRVPKFDIGNDWRSDVNYNDNGWQSVSGMPGGVGYEKSSGYEDLISLDVGFDMHESGGNPNTGCYIRIKFSLMQELVDQIDILTFRVRYDDGFAAFLNGERVVDANAPAGLTFNSVATQNHEANGQDEFNISDAGRLLHAGENLLAIHALNVSLTSSDFLFNIMVLAKNNPVKGFEESNLPLVFIDTQGQAIVDEPKIRTHMGVVYHGVGRTHRIDEAFNDYDGAIGIEIRGSSSAGWQKKQYSVETWDVNDQDSSVVLMGLPKESDWILNAPYIDKSFLRNVLSYDLSRRLGHYASRTRYCELFLNGEYKGIYILMEKIKRDKHRVGIAKLGSADIEGDALTGGYIIKIDKWGNDGFESEHPPLNGANRKIYYQYHYPADNVILPVQKAYIRNYIRAFEDMMDGDNIADPDTGYPAWIDVDSFIDFFLVNEISKNVDGYRLSTFIHKDRDDKDGHLKMGPVWDFNLAFGLANYYDAEDTDGWILDELSLGQSIKKDTWQVPFWWEKLFQDPGFNHRIKQRWTSLRGGVFDLNRLNAFIDAVADTLDDAKDRNFSIWTSPGEPKAPGDGFWPVPGIFSTFKNYQDEIDYLKSWITARVAWMDENIQLLSDIKIIENAGQPHSFVLHQNYPNPFNPSTAIWFELAASAHVRLEIYNIAGQQIKTVLDEQLNPGRHKASWDGRKESGAPAATGVYILRATLQQLSGRAVLSKKMMLMR